MEDRRKQRAVCGTNTKADGGFWCPKRPSAGATGKQVVGEEVSGCGAGGRLAKEDRGGRSGGGCTGVLDGRERMGTVG